MPRRLRAAVHVGRGNAAASPLRSRATGCSPTRGDHNPLSLWRSSFVPWTLDVECSMLDIRRFFAVRVPRVACQPVPTTILFPYGVHPLFLGHLTLSVRCWTFAFSSPFTCHGLLANPCRPQSSFLVGHSLFLRRPSVPAPRPTRPSSAAGDGASTAGGCSALSAIWLHRLIARIAAARFSRTSASFIRLVALYSAAKFSRLWATSG